eukprot:7861006-Prorocentrum_lima.AAC.1
MTSSLVGSEMCIRDSSGVVRRCCPRLPETARGSFRAVSKKRSKQPWPVAVSYTHLTLPTICSV